jgi:outer membrane receptor protein involved in Fe transport
VANGALISSSVELPLMRSGRDLSSLDSNRPLQGQSPYVLNAGAYYSRPDKGFQMSLQYNVFGKRIFAVGDKDSNPNQYEMPRNQIDLTITKEFRQHFELRFGIQDLLNQPYRLIQDSNRDMKITDVDEVISAYKFGQYTTLGIVWKL